MPARKVLLTSSRPCLLRSMALPSRRKRISETCYAFDTADLSNDCLPLVYVVQSTLLTILKYAREVALSTCAMTILRTVFSWHARRYIETHKANLTWSQSRESSSGTNQPSLLTMLALMLELEASGRECEMHFSSLVFFIPSHVVIPTLSLLPCTNCKQTHASGNTRNESETLKMGILLR